MVSSPAAPAGLRPRAPPDTPGFTGAGGLFSDGINTSELVWQALVQTCQSYDARHRSGRPLRALSLGASYLQAQTEEPTYEGTPPDVMVAATSGPPPSPPPWR